VNATQVGVLFNHTVSVIRLHYKNVKSNNNLSTVKYRAIALTCCLWHKNPP